MLEKLLDVPCPALQIATSDERGNLYYSGMVDTIAYQLVEPSSARVAAYPILKLR